MAKRQSATRPISQRSPQELVGVDVTNIEDEQRSRLEKLLFGLTTYPRTAIFARSTWYLAERLSSYGFLAVTSTHMIKMHNHRLDGVPDESYAEDTAERRQGVPFLAVAQVCWSGRSNSAVIVLPREWDVAKVIFLFPRSRAYLYPYSPSCHGCPTH